VLRGKGDAAEECEGAVYENEKSIADATTKSMYDLLIGLSDYCSIYINIVLR
jgi:hypothetical protein